MNLYECIDKIKDIALKQPNVRTFIEGNIYEGLNASNVEYGVIVVTQGRHTSNEYFHNFNFSIFYVDRLTSDMEKNRLEIQSIGIEVLSNIAKLIADELDMELNNLTFDVFTQRFKDECAGVYLTITFEVEKDLICGEDY